MTEFFIAVAVAIIGCSGIWSLVLYKVTRRDMMKDRDDKDTQAIKTALKGLLHQEIIRQGNYYTDRGDITKEELDDFRMYLYLPYKALDGNGVADIVMEELADLTKGGISL